MIRINQQWSIDRDDYNWILIESGKAKRSYFPWPEDALRYALDHSMQDAKTIREAKETFEQMRDQIRLCGRALAQNAEPYISELKREKTARRRAEMRLKTLEAA